MRWIEQCGRKEKGEGRERERKMKQDGKDMEEWRCAMAGVGKGRDKDIFSNSGAKEYDASTQNVVVYISLMWHRLLFRFKDGRKRTIQIGWIPTLQRQTGLPSSSKAGCSV